MDSPEIIFLLIGVGLLSGLGIVGCVAPALPGPPLSYGAVLLYHFCMGRPFSATFLIVSFVFVAATMLLDYLLPIYLTKRFGGTKYGILGGIIGLLIGFFIPPWGIILGPLIGAIVGDLVAGKQFESALRSGFGSFVGFLVATGAKLAVSITLTVFLIIKIVQLNIL